MNVDLDRTQRKQLGNLKLRGWWHFLDFLNFPRGYILEECSAVIRDKILFIRSLGEISNEILEELSEGITEEIFEGIPETMKNRISEGVSERMPEVPREIPKGIPENQWGNDRRNPGRNLLVREKISRWTLRRISKEKLIKKSRNSEQFWIYLALNALSWNWQGSSWDLLGTLSEIYPEGLYFFTRDSTRKSSTNLFY